MPDPAIARERLAAVDLSWIVAKFKRDYRYEDGEARRVVELYRKLLELAIDHPGQALLPPKGAAEVWRAHLLNTMPYWDDCMAVFGEYLHHDPSDFDQQRFREAWEFTRRRFKEKFGIELAPDEAEGAPSFEPDKRVIRSLLIPPG